MSQPSTWEYFRLLALIFAANELPRQGHVDPALSSRGVRRRVRIGKRIVGDLFALALGVVCQAGDRDARGRGDGAGGGVLPAGLDMSRQGFRAVGTEDAADNLVRRLVVAEDDVAEAPVNEVLVLEMGAARFGLGAGGPALVGGDEDDVVQRERTAAEGPGRVALVLQQQA